MEFSIQLSCWPSGLEVPSMKHDQIAWLLYWRRFGFLVIVFPHCFAGPFESLMTQLMQTCHLLNVVVGSGIPRVFCSWPVCSRVLTIFCKAWCHLECGMEGVVIGIFCHWQHFFPIILFVIAIISEITLQCLVDSFCLSIGLGMKG